MDSYSTRLLVVNMLAELALLNLFFAAYMFIALSGMAETFKKAGYKGFRVFIPGLNLYTRLELGGQNGWLALLLLIPIVGWAVLLVFCIMAYINIAKAFNKRPGFALGLILYPSIFWYILGYDKEKYNIKAIKNNTSNRANRDK